MRCSERGIAPVPGLWITCAVDSLAADVPAGLPYMPCRRIEAPRRGAKKEGAGQAPERRADDSCQGAMNSRLRFDPKLGGL